MIENQFLDGVTHNQIIKTKLKKGINSKIIHHKLLPIPLNLRTDKDIDATKNPAANKNIPMLIICDKTCSTLESRTSIPPPEDIIKYEDNEDKNALAKLKQNPTKAEPIRKEMKSRRELFDL